MSSFFNAAEQPKEGIVLGNNSPSDTDSHGRPQSKGKASSRAASEKSTLIEEPRNSNASRTSNIRAENTQKETANGATSTTPSDTAKDESPKEVKPNEDSNNETAVKYNAEKELKDDENKTDSDVDGEKSQEPEIEYPSAWKLVLITIALCFCVFCVALVSKGYLKCMKGARISNNLRITPSLQLPSLKLPINSTPSTMSAGMEAPTCLLLALSP